ncbi:hypothetical protein L226DRAFT_350586 [Lentinus tigrinus ALCF2SS1-7]|uniref:Transmembrane protein n=1 Tax=Lentinus tigrinus ALCF2SS1-6 TaxID=1328759 RepID=A0A5C2RT14_9APHY|nr:hypothetical protein L227DRAFT_616860 [Lentinus tigrinus ALCF2SS1-6]RPD76775.1 hypothetical protein L226DRAFT_350586 [Lentinus tigrinus ALCF2SS1-7]
MASFISSKARSLFGGSSASPASPTGDLALRPFSMASSVTVVPPSPVPPSHQQESTLATLQYQQSLMADFWSGSAARAPSPPTSSSTHTTSTGSSGGRKSKWANAIMVQEAERSARMQVMPEPKTRARLFFLLGFVFPLSWLLGASLLFYTPTPHPEITSLPVHSTEERERRLAAYHKAETKWAKRCLWAWMCVMAIVPVIVVAAVLASKHGS